MPINGISASNTITYDVYTSPMTPLVSQESRPPEFPQWSPMSHTLVMAGGEALISDPPVTKSQADALTSWINFHDVYLKYIYISHGHFDHWVSTAHILSSFPSARVIMAPEVQNDIRAQWSSKGIDSTYRDMFLEELPSLPRSFPVDTGFSGKGELSCHEFEIIDAGHSDGDNTTILHVQDLGLVIAGDVAYNNVHQYTAESANGGFDAWRRAIEMVEGLSPRFVIAGHRDPSREDGPEILTETLDYLNTVEEIFRSASSPNDYVRSVVAAFPRRINPYVPVFCAGEMFRNI